MRKVTEQAVRAFTNNQRFSQSNTRVTVRENRTELYLHGNLIAYKTENGQVSISNAGWTSNVTKERLNGLIDHYCGPGSRIYQHQWEWYFKGEESFPYNQFFVIN